MPFRSTIARNHLSLEPLGSFHPVRISPSAEDQDRSKPAVADLLAQAYDIGLATAAVLPRSKAKIGSELAASAERLPGSHRGVQQQRTDGTDALERCQLTADRVFLDQPRHFVGHGFDIFAELEKPRVHPMQAWAGTGPATRYHRPRGLPAACAAARQSPAVLRCRTRAGCRAGGSIVPSHSWIRSSRER